MQPTYLGGKVGLLHPKVRTVRLSVRKLQLHMRLLRKHRGLPRMQMQRMPMPRIWPLRMALRRMHSPRRPLLHRLAPWLPSSLLSWLYVPPALANAFLRSC